MNSKFDKVLNILCEENDIKLNRFYTETIRVNLNTGDINTSNGWTSYLTYSEEQKKIQTPLVENEGDHGIKITYGFPHGGEGGEEFVEKLKEAKVYLNDFFKQYFEKEVEKCDNELKELTINNGSEE